MQIQYHLFMDLPIRISFFGRIVHLHRSQKTHQHGEGFPPEELISIGMAVSVGLEGIVLWPSVPWSSCIGKRGAVISPWGIILMTVLIPTNGHKWWLKNSHNFSDSIINFSLPLDAFIMICIFPYPSLSIPIHPYAYSIPEPQVSDLSSSVQNRIFPV